MVPGMRIDVVGGGIFGVTAALELRRRGHEVELWDPSPPHPDASSTDISKVIRMDYGADRFWMTLMERALPLWEAWNQRFSRPLYHPEGFLILSPDMAPGGFEAESMRLLGERGHAVSPFQEHPVWRGWKGYLNPHGGWAESARVVEEVLGWALDAGVVLHRERADLAALDAEVVVVAAGAWTPSLVPESRHLLRSVGQPVLHFAPPDPERWRAPRFPTWAADIGRTGWYGFAANADGLLKIANHGVGVETDPSGPRLLPEGTHERFRAFLRQHLPELAELPVVGERLCLYCDAVDSDLLIDFVPRSHRMVVASGGSGHGFKFAPVLGPLVADCVEGRKNPWLPRLRWRWPKQRRFEQARNA